MPHAKILGGDGHDELPHAKILGGDGHDELPHAKILGGDQVTHGKSIDLVTGQTEFFNSDPELGLERHSIQKKVLISSNPVEPIQPVETLGEEVMPLLSKPGKNIIKKLIPASSSFIFGLLQANINAI